MAGPGDARVISSLLRYALTHWVQPTTMRVTKPCFVWATTVKPAKASSSQANKQQQKRATLTLTRVKNGSAAPPSTTTARDLAGAQQDQQK